MQNKIDYFNIIISARCIINIPSEDQQVKVIKNLEKFLSEDGQLILFECTKQGLANINKVRKNFDLNAIQEPWHNMYLDEQKFFNEIKNYFSLIISENYSSTYYLISRTLNAALTNQNSTPNYLSDLNNLAIKLPQLGDFSPNKLFILEKTKSSI